MKKVWIIACIGALLVSCTKPEPEELTVLPPLLRLDGEIDGEAVSFTPGVDGRYLFTRLVPLPFGRFLFLATVRNIQTPSQEEFTLRMIIDGDDHALATDLVSALSTGNQLIHLPLDQLGLRFESTSNQALTWNFGGGSLASTFFESSLDGMSGTALSISNGNLACPFPFSYEIPMLPWCDHALGPGLINVVVTQPLVRFYPPPFSAQFDAVTWKIGGEEYERLGGDVLEISNPGGNQIFVEVYADQHLGGSEPFAAQEVFLPLSPVCAIPMITAGVDGVHQPYFEVRYTDSQGNVFSSSHLCSSENLSPDAFLEITKVESFIPNELGKASVRVLFNAMLELHHEFPGNSLPSKSLHLHQGAVAFAIE